MKDRKLPSNVREGFNYYQTGFAGGENPVEGAKNIEVKNTKHGDIDEDITWTVVKEIVKRFIIS